MRRRAVRRDVRDLREDPRPPPPRPHGTRAAVRGPAAGVDARRGPAARRAAAAGGRRDRVRRQPRHARPYRRRGRSGRTRADQRHLPADPPEGLRGQPRHGAHPADGRVRDRSRRPAATWPRPASRRTSPTRPPPSPTWTSTTRTRRSPSSSGRRAPASRRSGAPRTSPASRSRCAAPPTPSTWPPPPRSCSSTPAPGSASRRPARRRCRGGRRAGRTRASTWKQIHRSGGVPSVWSQRSDGGGTSSRSCSASTCVVLAPTSRSRAARDSAVTSAGTCHRGSGPSSGPSHGSSRLQSPHGSTTCSPRKPQTNHRRSMCSTWLSSSIGVQPDASRVVRCSSGEGPAPPRRSTRARRRGTSRSRTPRRGRRPRVPRPLRRPEIGRVRCPLGPSPDLEGARPGRSQGAPGASCRPSLPASDRPARGMDWDRSPGQRQEPAAVPRFDISVPSYCTLLVKSMSTSLVDDSAAVELH